MLSARSGASRSQVQGWIAAGQVWVEGAVQTKTGFKLRGGEQVRYTVPDEAVHRVEPEQIEMEVLFEDAHLIAVNKPPGMVTHPAGSLVRGTLVNALLGRGTLTNLLDASGAALEDEDEDERESIQGFRPGIVHRLDRDTSGVIVVAKTVQAHAALAAAFRERRVRKTYLALSAGRITLETPSIQLDAPIGRNARERQKMAVSGLNAREAQTRFTPLETVHDPMGRMFSLIRAEPKTGRTHQIRVHLAYLKAPVLGDTTYGKPSDRIGRQALHALTLELPHPVTAQTLKLEAALPDDMVQAWLGLGGNFPKELL